MEDIDNLNITKYVKIKTVDGILKIRTKYIENLEETNLIRTCLRFNTSNSNINENNLKKKENFQIIYLYKMLDLTTHQIRMFLEYISKFKHKALADNLDTYKNNINISITLNSFETIYQHFCQISNLKTYNYDISAMYSFNDFMLNCQDNCNDIILFKNKIINSIKLVDEIFEILLIDFTSITILKKYLNKPSKIMSMIKDAFILTKVKSKLPCKSKLSLIHPTIGGITIKRYKKIEIINIDIQYKEFILLAFNQNCDKFISDLIDLNKDYIENDEMKQKFIVFKKSLLTFIENEINNMKYSKF